MGKIVFPALFKIDFLWICGVFMMILKYLMDAIVIFVYSPHKKNHWHLPSLIQEHTFHIQFKKCVPGANRVNSICDNLTNHPTKMSHKILKIQDNQLGKGESLSSIPDAHSIYKNEISEN